MATYEVNVEEVEPMSRTYQYRKVMKPMLERKRRARINKCLDELKDLMVGALQSEGESITKLEKADVLELTVRHLKKLRQHHALVLPSQNQAQEKFRAGFGQCAAEVRRFVRAVPGVDLHVSARLLNHLGQWMDKLAPPPPSPPGSPPALLLPSPKVYTPPASPELHNIPQLSPACQPLSLTTKPSANSPPAPPSPIRRLCITTRTPSGFAHNPLPPLDTPEGSPAHTEPLNFSPRLETGIKVELPQDSPVWRPWSA